MDRTDDSSDEAMVMPPEGPALFVGPFREACEHVWALPPDERAGLRIWTEQLTYEAAGIDTLREDRERDALPASMIFNYPAHRARSKRGAK